MFAARVPWECGGPQGGGSDWGGFTLVSGSCQQGLLLRSPWCRCFRVGTSLASPPWREMTSQGRHGGGRRLWCRTRARRGGREGKSKIISSSPVHPWSGCQHLKSALGTPPKPPSGRGARTGDVVQPQVGDQGALKTVQDKGFPLEKKCEKGGWAGLAA